RQRNRNGMHASMCNCLPATGLRCFRKRWSIASGFVATASSGKSESLGNSSGPGPVCRSPSTNVGGAASSISGPKAARAEAGVRCSHRHPKQLGKEVAQICRGIPASTPIEIEDHDAPISPEQVGRTEVAVHERGGPWGRRCVAFKRRERLLQRIGFGGEPSTEVSDARPNVVDQIGG